MIARPLASADIAIDACTCQPRCQRRTQKEMVDAKARVALECVAQVLPERVDAFPRMRRADGIDPALRDQLAKSFAYLGPSGNRSCGAFNSCRHAISGCDSSSQRNRVGNRAVMPLTLKVAIFTSCTCGSAGKLLGQH
jgi:hypothetical protein